MSSIPSRYPSGASLLPPVPQPLSTPTESGASRAATDQPVHPSHPADDACRRAAASALDAATRMEPARKTGHVPLQPGLRHVPANMPTTPVLPLPHPLLQIAACYAPREFHRLCKASDFRDALLGEKPDQAWIGASLAQAVEGLTAQPFNREARGLVEVFRKMDVSLRLAQGRAQILEVASSAEARESALRAHYLRFAGEFDPILIAHEMAALEQATWSSTIDKMIAVLDLCRAGFGVLSSVTLEKARQNVARLNPEDRARLPLEVAEFADILERMPNRDGIFDRIETCAIQ